MPDRANGARAHEEQQEAAREKLVQYIEEAHGLELALTRTLQAHVAVTPAGSYRTGLEQHLEETRDHAARLQRRLRELGASRNPLEVGLGVIQTIVGQTVAIGKAPLDMVRGSGGEERLLKNAKDEVASEALEIATYDALERFARRVGDAKTAALAARIRSDEERMLARLRREIVSLADAVVRADVEDEPSYDVTATGAADQVRDISGSVRKRAGTASKRARTTARQARRVPGVTRIEGEVKGAVAAASDLALSGYDELTVDEVTARLPELSQIELAKVAGYERSHRNRSGVIERIDALRSDEPWPGYDDQGVEDVRRQLARADDERVAQVQEYERRHKARAGVLQATERQLAPS